MNITSAWEGKVTRSLHTRSEFAYIFEQTTKYQSSPLDKLELLVNAPLSQEFHDLRKTHARKYYLQNAEGPYFIGYSFGPVRVLVNPRFPNVPATKIIINPSEGGLSVSQILAWVDIIVGTLQGVRVCHIDGKVDLKNFNTKEAIARIYVPNLNKYNEWRIGETLYIGSSNYNRQLIIYDKAKESDVDGDWTRIEMRYKWVKKEQPLLVDFIRDLQRFNPLEDCILMMADEPFFEKLTKKYGIKVCVGSAFQTLKSLNSHRRKTVLQSLSAAGKTLDLANEYDKQLSLWLQQQVLDGYIAEGNNIDLKRS